MGSGQENPKSESDRQYIRDLLHFSKCYCKSCEHFFRTEYYRYPEEIPNLVLDRLLFDCRTRSIVQEIF